MIKKEFGSLITCDPQFQDVIETATNVAQSKATILIYGESGTGKELLAKYIHDRSPRSHRRFVAINCAAVPEGLLESELFGYERGAFTGAVQAKPGKFERANESTILLDEISEMPLGLQAKLLRVLQQEEVDRLGGKTPVKVNIRIIATTNRDLAAMVKDGKFREDLYYRINVIPLRIPSLRERQEDVITLAEHFLRVSAILNGRNVNRLSPGAVVKLKQWKWPGNVRELENVVERAVLLCRGEEIRPDHIQVDARLASQVESQIAVGMTIAEMEKNLILKTLEQTRQNRTQAARLLGISIRTLRNKLNEYRQDGGNHEESV
ncbi:MAG: sigma-54-dependent Fis family transcriptional regulator [Oligoflexia bacterium]|nr:sigma-54-dependent Fis family transcriptional regulator [Oligoflexia bacterium]